VSGKHGYHREVSVLYGRLGVNYIETVGDAEDKQDEHGEKEAFDNKLDLMCP
jgi:hypothetical protein